MGAHRLERQLDGRQLGAEVLRDDLLVVEPHHGDIARDRETALLHRLVCTHGHSIVTAEDRSGPMRQTEQFHGGFVSAVGHGPSGQHQLWIDRDPSLG